MPKQPHIIKVQHFLFRRIDITLLILLYSNVYHLRLPNPVSLIIEPVLYERHFVTINLLVKLFLINFNVISVTSLLSINMTWYLDN